jgi:hypothetical protein
VFGVSGINLILTIRESTETPLAARMRFTTRCQTWYDRAAQSANTRRS